MLSKENEVNSNITILYGSLPEARSASAQGEHGCYIALDYSMLWGGKEARTALYHELGHCATGSFYNMYAPLDIRVKHEVRADRWAIEQLIPRDRLAEALAQGRDLWELSDIFSVTPQFILKAEEYYLTKEIL